MKSIIQNEGYSLAAFPDETLLLIADCLEPQSVSRLARSCRRYYEGLTPILYREPSIQSMASLNEFLKTVKSSASLASLVLEFRTAAIAYRWSDFKPAHLQTLSEHCRNLEFLELDTIRFDGQWTVSELPRLKALRLELLNISGEDLVTLLLSFWRGNPAISELALVHLHELRDYHLSKIAEGFKQLTILDVSSNFRITEISVTKLIEECQTLKFLDLSHCAVILEPGLIDSVKNRLEIVID